MTSVEQQSRSIYERYSTRREKPSSEQLPRIVARYTVASASEEFVAANNGMFCCHCQRCTHWRGFIVCDDEGANYTIGKDCGPKHYGKSFNAALNDFNAQQQLERDTEYLGRINAGDIRERLIAFQGLEAIRHLANAKSQLRSGLDTFADSLRADLRRHSGSLSRVGDDGRPVLLGRLEGAALFSLAQSPADLALSLVDTYDFAVQSHAATDVRKHTQKLGRIGQQFLTSLAEHNAIKASFTVKNISLLNGWLRTQGTTPPVCSLEQQNLIIRHKGRSSRILSNWLPHFDVEQYAPLATTNPAPSPPT